MLTKEQMKIVESHVNAIIRETGMTKGPILTPQEKAQMESEMKLTSSALASASLNYSQNAQRPGDNFNRECLHTITELSEKLNRLTLIFIALFISIYQEGNKCRGITSFHSFMNDVLGRIKPNE